MSKREQILAAPDIKSETVEIPEWGEAGEGLVVRGMTADERADFLEECIGEGGQKPKLRVVYALAVVRTLRDSETGELVFTEADRDAVGGKSGAVVERIALAALGQSGLTKDDVKRLGKGSTPLASVASTSN